MFDVLSNHFSELDIGNVYFRDKYKIHALISAKNTMVLSGFEFGIDWRLFEIL
jgi:3-dehydroquinate dehydratase